jgi:hypothetical protein
MILVVLAILMVVMIASTLVSRLAASSGEVALATARLVVAQNALEAYAAASGRLPCPANQGLPAGDLDDGVEMPGLNGVCAFPTGTLPWRALNMRRDDAIDPWGRKLSYRVETRNKGSLTQPNGVRMVACNTAQSPPSGGKTDTGPGSLGGLCRGDLPNTDINLRTTTPDEFLDGKGMTLDDMGTKYTDVAYVILSHGETGYGGFTAASGTPMPGAKGDEDKNTKATGDFKIQAHSDYDQEATNSNHFDDLLVYRRLPDLIQRIGLWARAWVLPGSLVFNRNSVSAAIGSTVTPGSSTGRSTLNFGGAGQVSGRTGGSTPTNITLDTSAGTDGLGVAGGASNMLDSSGTESLEIKFFLGGRNLGLSLANIGSYVTGPDTYYEAVRVNFYLDDTEVGVPLVGGCQFADGGRGDLSFDVAQIFNRIVITPLPAYNFTTKTFTGTSSFLVAEARACDTAVTCKTSLDDGSRACLTGPFP